MHELADRVALKTVRETFWSRYTRGYPLAGFDFARVYDDAYIEAIYAYAAANPPEA